MLRLIALVIGLVPVVAMFVLLAFVDGVIQYRRTATDIWRGLGYVVRAVR